MAFKLISSESLDVLAGELSANLYSGVSSVLDMPKIIIQSAGMQRWLSLRIADNLGITAGVEFYFLNGFFEEVIVSSYASAQAEKLDSLSPDHLKWLIFAVLSELKDEKIFKALNSYIQGDMLKQLQLAHKLAELYDKYTLYRADWLLSWAELGADGYSGEYKDGFWLAELWKIVKSKTKLLSVAELSTNCIEWLASTDFFYSPPVHLFGVSSMPPLYLQILTEASRHMDVYFYYLEVSHEYWGLVRSEKELLRKAGSNYEEGNSLLATFGDRNKDFLNLLTNYAADSGFVEKENEVYGSHNDVTDCQLPLMSRLQAGVRFMTQPVKKSVVASSDRSVQFHSCCGRMRQVQALYQSLLDCFNVDNSLKPKDILVLTPVIRDFVPYIRAVFGSVSRDSNKYIPFTISDRAVIDDNNVCRGLLSVLRLFSGRFKVSEVWNIYSDPIFFECNGGVTEELDDVCGWINKLQTHWGVDGEHKKSVNGIIDNECTWKEAEERLLLGYATGDQDTLFELRDGRKLLGVDVSGSIDALEHWLMFLAKIFDFKKRYSRVSTAVEWIDFTRSLLEGFYSQSGNQKQDILLILDELAQVFFDVGISLDELAFDVYFSEFSSALESVTSGTGFIMGGVTFCQFQPMRNIPGKIICMLGMDDGAFPRIIKPVTFDIAVKQRRLCDPSLKLDDQGGFLETILSVSEKLLIFYSGLGVKKGEELVPAVPIELLRDYIGRYYLDADGGNGVLDQLTISHPLQSFSNKYFVSEDGNKLTSYSVEDYNVAVKIISQGRKSTNDLVLAQSVDIAESIAVQPILSLAELIKFFQSPCRYYLQQECNIYMESLDQVLPEDAERLATDRGYKLHDIKYDILQKRISGAQKEDIFNSIEAARVLPIGRLGSDTFGRLYEETDALANVLSGINYSNSGDLAGNILVDICTDSMKNMGEVKLEYTLEALNDLESIKVNTFYYFSNSISWRNLISVWLKHLVYSAVLNENEYFESHLYNSSGKLEFGYSRFSFLEAQRSLQNYIFGYYTGLNCPLPVFKGASLEYGKQRTSSRSAKTVEEALLLASQKYRGSGFGTDYPDSKDQYIAKCYGSDFTDNAQNMEDFVYWAEKLVLPVYEFNRAKELGKGK